MSPERKEDGIGGLMIVVKEGESISIGEAEVYLEQVGGHKVGKAVKVWVRAPREIKIQRIKKVSHERAI